MKKKLFIALACVIVLQGCVEPSPEDDPRKKIIDLDKVKREWAAWEAQGIASYSFVEKFKFLLEYQAKVTVTDNAVTGIEILGLDEKREWEWKSLKASQEDPRAQVLDPEELERIIETRMTNYINDVTAYTNDFGDISRIYNELTLNRDSEYHRDLRIEVRYNAEYHYPEYIRWQIVTPGAYGNYPTIIEISNFEIAK